MDTACLELEQKLGFADPSFSSEPCLWHRRAFVGRPCPVKFPMSSPPAYRRPAMH